MAKQAKYKKSFDSDIKLGNNNFQKILKFYLFECPTPGKSRRGTTFEGFGWQGTKQFSKLKTLLLAAASNSLKFNYYPCSKNELPDKFSMVEKVSPVDEYCVFLKTDEKTVMQSLFSAIRNAFAHGSFCVKKYEKTQVYFFSNYDNYLKAEIILQEDTLIKWIDIIRKGP